MKISWNIIFILSSLNPCIVISAKEKVSTIDIPDDFLFGAGTSAFQVEGSLKSHGRSESILDRLISHKSLSDSPDISSDSYHKYKEDVKVLKYIGLDIYRFSMSWTRLLPTGYSNHVNQEGVNYYHDLLDDLEQAGIEPMVQLHHFDHPAVFGDYGGWQNETIIERFKDYARFVFTEFGHRVKYFLTFNEANVLCNVLDSGVLNAQDKIESTFPRIYACSHNVLKAHAGTYNLYHKEFNHDKKGKISINLLCNDYIVEEKKDQYLVDVAFAFSCGWFADPIFSKLGDYPDILKQRVKETNSLRGYENLELPAFSKRWIKNIRGTADFFALSYYSTRLVALAPENDLKSSFNSFFPPEARLILKPVSTWLPTTNDNYIVPSGLRTILKKIKKQYNNPPVHIIENGCSDDGRLNDKGRIKFIYAHVKQIIDAINHNQCNVKSYIHWSLIDNFEFWNSYNSHFGLVHVDFNSPNRTRTPKESATWLRNVLLTRQLYIEE